MQGNKLSINDLARGFNVSTVSLHLWRKGTPTKEPLPHEVVTIGGQRRVAFGVAATKAWAKKHGLEFNLDAAKAGEVKKAGPKASTRKRVKH